jgi:predicted nucleotidyltransferase
LASPQRFEKETVRRIKPLLYVYRVLLTGIHLMKTGEVEANLLHLIREYPLPYVPDLVGRKLSGPEHSALGEADFEFHRREYDRLRGELQSAYDASALPEATPAKPALQDLLLRLRGG